MADEENTQEVGSEDAVEPTKSKRGLILGGSVMALIATAGLAALLAVPANDEHPDLEGPFVMPLTEMGEIQVNLRGDGNRRYLVMILRAEYDAFTMEYGLGRIADPLYQAKLQDQLLSIASQYTSAEVLETGTQEIFLQEVFEAVDPLLFPIHFGDALLPEDADSESGLAPGKSIARSTMFSPLYDQSILVDDSEHTISLGEGDALNFSGDETDLKLEDERGRIVYVDVSDLKEGFQGEVNVGIRGRLRAVYKDKYIVQ